MRFLLIAIILLLTVPLMAADLGTMPAANQLKAKEFDIAFYYLDLEQKKPGPQFVQYQTIYLGLTDNLELDIHRCSIDRNETSVVLAASYKVMSQTVQKPDLVLSVRNITGEPTINNSPRSPIDMRGRSKKVSYALSAAKTIPFIRGTRKPPLVRVHLSLGTEDWSLLGKRRHDGVFGGLQFLFTPEFGAVMQYEGHDNIAALLYMPPRSGLMFKVGSFGPHTWVGVAYKRHM